MTSPNEPSDLPPPYQEENDVENVEAASPPSREVKMHTQSDREKNSGQKSAAFCNKCGAPIEDPSWRFCGKCANAALETSGAQGEQQHVENNQQKPVAATNAERSDMAVRIGDRLIFDFEKHPCCCYGAQEDVGLHPRVASEIPPELAEKGVQQEEWRSWIVALNELQSSSPAICCIFSTFLCPGVFAQFFLCLLCPLSANHCLSGLPCCFGDWHYALKTWMNDVNSALSTHGMHAKFTTYKPWNHAPKSKMFQQRVGGKDENYEMSFLEIALTQKESDVLKAESWSHGVNDICISGIHWWTFR